jgi:hypothetical protein
MSLYLTNLALRHEGVWRSGCIDPRLLELDTGWRWVVSFTPLPHYPRGKSFGTHWIGGWVDHRAGLDNMKKWKFLTLPVLELRPLGRPASSQSLNRLRYPGSWYLSMLLKMSTKCKIIIIVIYCHVYEASIDAVWIGNRIYWTLIDRNYK